MVFLFVCFFLFLFWGFSGKDSGPFPFCFCVCDSLTTSLSYIRLAAGVIWFIFWERSFDIWWRLGRKGYIQIDTIAMKVAGVLSVDWYEYIAELYIAQMWAYFWNLQGKTAWLGRDKISICATWHVNVWVSRSRRKTTENNQSWAVFLQCWKDRPELRDRVPRVLAVSPRCGVVLADFFLVWNCAIAELTAFASSVTPFFFFLFHFLFSFSFTALIFYIAILLSFFRNLIGSACTLHRRISPRNEFDSCHSWFLESVAQPIFYLILTIALLTIPTFYSWLSQNTK